MSSEEVCVAEAEDMSLESVDEQGNEQQEEEEEEGSESSSKGSSLKIDHEDAQVVGAIFEHFFCQFKRVLLLHHGLICMVTSPIAKLHATVAERCGAPFSPRSLFWDDFIKLEKAYKGLVVFLNDLAKFYEKTNPLTSEEIEAISSIKSSVWKSLSSEMKENLPPDAFSNKIESNDLVFHDFFDFLLVSPSKRLSIDAAREVIYLITDKQDWSEEAFTYLDAFSRELRVELENCAAPLFSESPEDDRSVQYFFDFDTQFPFWRQVPKLPAKTPDSGLESAMSVFVPESDETNSTPQPTLLSAVPEVEEIVMPEEEEQEEDMALLGFNEREGGKVTKIDESARQGLHEEEESLQSVVISEMTSVTGGRITDESSSSLSRRESGAKSSSRRSRHSSIERRARSKSPDSRSRDSGLSGGTKIAVIGGRSRRDSDRDRSRRSRRSTSGERVRSSRSGRRSASPRSRRRSRSRSLSPRRSRHYEDRYHPYARRGKPLYEGTNA